MINDLCNRQEETVTANNEKEAKINLQTYNPNLNVLDAKMGL